MAEFFQTDATINTGNSGGPMFNMKGEVIGIVSHNISKGGGSEGLGFVVTLNTAKQLLLEKRSFWAGLEGDRAERRGGRSPERAGGSQRLHRQDGGEGLARRPDRPAGEPDIVRIGGQDVPLGGDIIMSIEGVAMAPANFAKIRDMIGRLPAGAPFKVSSCARDRCWS